mmetsp:Transcript_81166/g.194772  ORF Transcript_81166/g.194772 Transcript_81166/m.194772 type:complete len:260 (+) Transcript_81166:165-944(+)
MMIVARCLVLRSRLDVPGGLVCLSRVSFDVCQRTPFEGLHGLRQHYVAQEVHELHLDVGLGHRQVEETILAAVVPLWAPLGCDPAPAAGDDTGQLPLQELKLLLVNVASDEEIQAQVPQLRVPVALMTAGKVRDGDLPVRLRRAELLLHPLSLPAEQAPEPGLALLRRGGSPRRRAGSLLVEFAMAQVGAGTGIDVMSILNIGVEHEVVDLKTQIRILHVLAEVEGRHDPSVAGPSVGNLLVPGVVELTSTVVVVAEDG